MAGQAAVVAVDRFVRNRDPRARIVVAGETELVARVEEQRIRVGGVGIMTILARSVFEGLVLNVTIHQVFGIVAFEAEFAIFSRHFERIAIIRGVVARFALGSDHGIVGARLHELGLFRAVGVVAAAAGPLLDGIFAMGLLERRIIALVAGRAQLRFGHLEEIALRRGVGQMTFRAAHFHQIAVRDLLGISLRFVAFEADRIPFRTQEIG